MSKYNNCRPLKIPLFQANNMTEQSSTDFLDLLVQQNEIIKQQEILIQQQKQQIELQEYIFL